MASEERHLPASERQRERFAERGEVPRSRDLSSALLLCAGAGGAYMGVIEAAARLRLLVQEDFSHLPGGLTSHFWRAQAHAVAAIVFPMMVACLLGVGLSAALQTGGRFRLTPIALKWERLAPLSRLKQIFSFEQAGKQIAWSLLKLTVLGLIAWKTLVSAVPAVLVSYSGNLAAAAQAYGIVVGKLVVRSLAALLVIGCADYAMSWWQLEKRMRMTYEEMREEHKQESGDPRLRGMRRRRHRDIVKRSGVLGTKRAHVVLVNPNHYAVALRYDAATMRAPIVVAKGADHAAERIRRVAREHNVPIVSQPPLTRLLFARVGVNKAVPQDLYQAVALVLAYVYGLRRSA